MQHKFLLAKPYGLANQKLYYIQIHKTLEKKKTMFLSMVGEYRPALFFADKAFIHENRN